MAALLRGGAAVVVAVDEVYDDYFVTTIFLCLSFFPGFGLFLAGWVIRIFCFFFFSIR